MIPGKSHYLIHHKLLFKSLTVALLTEKLREFYKLPDNGLELKNRSFEGIYSAKNEWVEVKYPDEIKSYFEKFVSYSRYSEGEALQMASDKVRSEVLEFVYKIADKLGIDRHTFEEFVMFGIVPDKPKNESLRIVFNKDFPISEPGVYLKIGLYTKGADLVRDYKNYKPFIDNFYKVVYKIETRRKSTGADLYEEVESKIKEYYQLKSQAKKSRNKLDEKEYRKIVDNTFRDLASEDVPDNIKDDKEWQTWVDTEVKVLETQYYATTRRYNLPTVRDLKVYLRLIPNN